jgi:hypothetical protein
MTEDLKLQLQAGKKMWLYVVITVLTIYVVKPKVIIFTIHFHYLYNAVSVPDCLVL